MGRFIRLLIVSGMSLTCAGAALGNSFFLRYDADGTFPDQEGWTRGTSDPQGGLIRTVEDSVFRINSMASTDAHDLYSVWGPALVPGPGQFLRVDWRMRVLQQTDTGLDWFGDAGMDIARTYGQSASFNLGPTVVSSLTAGYSGYQVLSVFQPGTWHTYSFLTDLQEFVLSVEGQPVLQGVLYTSVVPHIYSNL